MKFEKGNNANPNGARKARQFYDMLNVAMTDDKANPGGLRKIADNLVKQAQLGEAWAIREVADRLDGKPAQTVRGDENAPLMVNTIERIIVDSSTGSDTESL
jgi:hypothetical protein